MKEILSNSQLTILIILIAFRTIPWKGVALWKSAGQKDKIWFIIMLLVNTLGILEILYIFIFSKRGGQSVQPEQVTNNPKIV